MGTATFSRKRLCNAHIVIIFACSLTCCDLRNTYTNATTLCFVTWNINPNFTTSLRHEFSGSGRQFFLSYGESETEDGEVAFWGSVMEKYGQTDGHNKPIFEKREEKGSMGVSQKKLF